MSKDLGVKEERDEDCDAWKLVSEHVEQRPERKSPALPPETR